jgi:DNA-binding XRE family transcriptional regulator
VLNSRLLVEATLYVCNQFFKALGARIAALRKEQGLSLQALADQLGIAQQTLATTRSGASGRRRR